MNTYLNNNSRLIFLVCCVAIVIAACQPTVINPTTASSSAQTLMPNLAGYTKSNADGLVNALTTAGAGAALSTGNVPVAAAVARAEAVVQCLQDTGAIDANMYVESAPRAIIPEAGAVVIINETRLNQNLLACILSTNNPGIASAQAVSIEPCIGSGSFTYNQDDISFIYVGVGDDVCSRFQTHFQSLGATVNVTGGSGRQ